MIVDPAVAYVFHHGEMFQVVVCLEERISREKLDKNASYTPDVARE